MLLSLFLEVPVVVVVLHCPRKDHQKLELEIYTTVIAVGGLSIVKKLIELVG